MIDLNKYPTIITHLKGMTKLYDDSSSHIVIGCPLCDDEYRKQNPDHGHCYITKHNSVPLFFCFRCSTGGTLLRLLISTDFDDFETLEILKKLSNFSFGKNYNFLKPKKTKKDPIKEISQNIVSFQENYPNLYSSFQTYLFNRIGECNYMKFLLSPRYYNGNVVIDFYNYDSELVTTRPINIKQYFKQKNEAQYYFQEFDIDKYKNYVLCEGPFDSISLYLFGNFKKNTYFLSICGSFFNTVAEKLIVENLLVGKYTINIIFDIDTYGYKKQIYQIQKIASIYNNDIEVRGWLPHFKDTGEFPLIYPI